MGKHALVTYVRDEMVLLPGWYAYLSQAYDPDDVHIIDDGSTDGTFEWAVEQGFHVHSLPEEFSLRRHGVDAVARYVTQVFADVLVDHASAFLCDADDRPLPMTGDLKQWLDSFAASGKEYVTLRNCTVCQDPDTLAISYWSMKKFDNPLLWSARPRWSRGFHNVDNHKPSPDEGELACWIVDLHTADIAQCEARHQTRLARGTSVMCNCLVGEELKRFFRDRPQLMGMVPLRPGDGG